MESITGERKEGIPWPDSLLVAVFAAGAVVCRATKLTSGQFGRIFTSVLLFSLSLHSKRPSANINKQAARGCRPEGANSTSNLGKRILMNFLHDSLNLNASISRPSLDFIQLEPTCPLSTQSPPQVGRSRVGPKQLVHWALNNNNKYLLWIGTDFEPVPCRRHFSARLERLLGGRALDSFNSYLLQEWEAHGLRLC